MPGKLIWLVSPPGSGKDSLLAALHQREHPQLLVAHRYITRPSSVGSENHIAPNEHEFFTRAEQHLFALSWHANNTYYGIDVEIDLRLRAGFDVIADGSRVHLALTWKRYGEVLVPIYLAVSPPILRQRLGQCSRENALEITQRLDHAARYKPSNRLTLSDDESLRQLVDDFFCLLRSHVAHVEGQPV